jgi:hypothetical protein
MTDSTAASVNGTPEDYGDTLYRVYFEVGEWEGIARDAITAFLVERASDNPAFDFDASLLYARPYGYEVDLPMQLIPEVVRALAERRVMGTLVAVPILLAGIGVAWLDTWRAWPSLSDRDPVPPAMIVILYVLMWLGLLAQAWLLWRWPSRPRQVGTPTAVSQAPESP